MMKLGGKLDLIPTVNVGLRSLLLQVSTATNMPDVLKKKRAYLCKDENDRPVGFSHYLFVNKAGKYLESAGNFIVLPGDYYYLDHDDILRITAEGSNIRVLYRASSPHNFLLMTEQCNHYCLMCSQPPRTDDDSWLLDELEQVIPMIPKNAFEIGFTGGETTQSRDRFLKIINMTKSYLPRTAVHILSNGRSFADVAFTEKYAKIGHHDAMVGIPLYSDDPTMHDYIVQAKGAFDETIQGILCLKRYDQLVEIRIVLHKLSIQRLKELCEFISRNLLFVDHVALMGLEITGFTRANLDELWIDPHDYKDTLSEAVKILAATGIRTSVYNHQLCLVNQDVMPYYRKSISDWKNDYASECMGCAKKDECGGFFASGIKHGYSQKLIPFAAEGSRT